MRQDIINTARKRIGTPFKHQGRKAGVGLDCIGLIINVLSEFDSEIIKHDRPNYSALPQRNRLKENLDTIFKKVDHPKIADILLFSYGRYPQHVGFYTGNSVIHAYAAVGKVIKTSIDILDPRIIEIYDIGVSDG